jgi:peptide methionine sulfoxide reductase msrA/msrB
VYDPARITYHQLVVFFWHNVDPLTPNAQFCDNGTQYGTAIFYRNAAQQAVAENTKQYVLRWFRVRSIPTRVAPAGRFYPAEEQHQDYASKDSSAFEFYRMGCNRETRLAELWGRKAGTYVRGWDPLRFEKPSDEQLRASLTPLQYQVTQEGATEPANDNEFWDHKLPGIYVDVVSGEPLFGSPDKFDAGAGWPSFSGPLDPTVVIEYPDSSGETVRTGVRSTFAGSRLGHVIDDPRSPTGKRYSINSAALRFIHADRLVAEGYRDLAVLFSPEARYRQARD